MADNGKQPEPESSAAKAARMEAYNLKNDSAAFLKNLHRLQSGFGTQEPKLRIYKDSDPAPTKDEENLPNALNFEKDVRPELERHLGVLKLDINERALHEILVLANGRAEKLENSRIKKEESEKLPAEMRSDVRSLNELPYGDQVTCFLGALEEYAISNKRFRKVADEDKKGLRENILTAYLNRIYEGDSSASSVALKGLVESAVEACCTQGGEHAQLQRVTLDNGEKIIRPSKIPKPENAGLLLDTATHWIPLLGYDHPLVKAVLPAALRSETSEGWEKRDFDQKLYDTLKGFSQKSTRWCSEELNELQSGKLLESLATKSPKAFLEYSTAFEKLEGVDYMKWYNHSIRAAGAAPQYFLDHFELMMGLFENKQQQRDLIESAGQKDPLGLASRMPEIVRLGVIDEENLRHLQWRLDSSHALAKKELADQFNLPRKELKLDDFSDNQMRQALLIVKNSGTPDQTKTFLQSLSTILESELFGRDDVKTMVQAISESDKALFLNNLRPVAQSKLFSQVELGQLVKTLAANSDVTGVALLEQVSVIDELKCLEKEEFQSLIKAASEKYQITLIKQLSTISKLGLFNEEELHELVKTSISNAKPENNGWLYYLPDLMASGILSKQELKELVNPHGQHKPEQIYRYFDKVVASQLFDNQELREIAKSSLDAAPNDFLLVFRSVIDIKPPLFDNQELADMLRTARGKDASGLLHTLPKIAASKLVDREELRGWVNEIAEQEAKVIIGYSPPIVQSRIFNREELQALVDKAIEKDPAFFLSRFHFVAKAKIFSNDELTQRMAAAGDKNPEAMVQELPWIIDRGLDNFDRKDVKQWLQSASRKAPAAFFENMFYQSTLDTLSNKEVINAAEMRGTTHDAILGAGLQEGAARTSALKGIKDLKWLRAYKVAPDDLETLIKDMVKSRQFTNDELGNIQSALRAVLRPDTFARRPEWPQLQELLKKFDELFTPPKDQKNDQKEKNKDHKTSMNKLRFPWGEAQDGTTVSPLHVAATRHSPDLNQDKHPAAPTRPSRGGSHVV